MFLSNSSLHTFFLLATLHGREQKGPQFMLDIFNSSSTGRRHEIKKQYWKADGSIMSFKKLQPHFWMTALTEHTVQWTAYSRQKHIQTFWQEASLIWRHPAEFQVSDKNRRHFRIDKLTKNKNTLINKNECLVIEELKIPFPQAFPFYPWLIHVTVQTLINILSQSEFKISLL